MLRVADDWTHVEHPLFKENTFVGADREEKDLPTFAAGRDLLPRPHWAGHQDSIDCYWKAWALAFSNLCQPHPDSGLIANFIDTAFNQCFFMWDSVFILMFGRYGRHAFEFQRTLDNFYAKQHPDGFICREIERDTGLDRFVRFDPSATGPNVMPWCEWEYYLESGDRERLAAVFPPLVAYTDWLRLNYTWKDGSYFSSGYGCGMDNIPRQPAGYNHALQHGHMSWIDSSLQALAANVVMQKMATVLGREADVSELGQEAERLGKSVDEHMWLEGPGFYVDRFRDGTLSDVLHIGAYWALHAGIGGDERIAKLVSHLEDEQLFSRPHPVPALAANHPLYEAGGGYWRGGVWAPTNYMVLRGLTEQGCDALAHEIARKHVDMITQIFVDTGSVWENSAPEYAKPGSERKDFVGWGGLPPITVLFEYVFGLRPDVPAGRLVWDVRLLDEHGIDDYPFGKDGLVQLHCAARSSVDEEPEITASSTVPVELEVRWREDTRIAKLDVVSTREH